MKTYEVARVTDYGSLIDLTSATGLFGAEDMANKLVPMHHVPVPSAPSG
jgi:hypothetical protein